MANWASTSYRIVGNENDLQELFLIIKAFMDNERPTMTERTTNDWEGNVVLALGESIENCRIRGFIQTYELGDGVLSIETEEAWGITDFRHILEHHFKDMKVYYVVEEPGMEIYATNDVDGRFFTCNFMVDSCVDGKDDVEYFDTLKEAFAYICKRLGRGSISIADINKWNEEHENSDDYIFLHEFELIP